MDNFCSNRLSKWANLMRSNPVFGITQDNQLFTLIEKETGIKTNHSRFKQWTTGQYRSPVALNNLTLLPVIRSHLSMMPGLMEMLNVLLREQSIESTADQQPDINIVNAWLAVTMADHQFVLLKDALLYLAQHTGVHVQHGRFGEWNRGVMRPPLSVVNFMIRKVIYHYLADYPNIANELSGDLVLPEKPINRDKPSN